ncbi:MAG: permease [Tissierellia bacterium]|nr:permease [Tissierellia bacterium]
MKKILDYARKNLFLSFVILVYALLLIFKTPLALGAIKNSGYYFKEMLFIMPVILLLTALLNAWVPKETIQKHLGSGSGFKGSVFSFILGSISAGPIYAAFPVAITLLKKGASVTNVVVLLSSWAVVKIPMLANEAKFLGPKFMLMRWVLTTIAIFLTGAICSKFVSREEILELHPEEDSLEQLSLDSEFCIGCGVCVKLDPAHFAMLGKKAEVISLKNLQTPELIKAVQSCPVQIIHLETSSPRLKAKTAPARS